MFAPKSPASAKKKVPLSDSWIFFGSAPKLSPFERVAAPTCPVEASRGSLWGAVALGLSSEIGVGTTLAHVSK